MFLVDHKLWSTVLPAPAYLSRLGKKSVQNFKPTQQVNKTQHDTTINNETMDMTTTTTPKPKQHNNHNRTTTTQL